MRSRLDQAEFIRGVRGLARGLKRQRLEQAGFRYVHLSHAREMLTTLGAPLWRRVRVFVVGRQLGVHCEVWVPIWLYLVVRAFTRSQDPEVGMLRVPLTGPEVRAAVRLALRDSEVEFALRAILGLNDVPSDVESWKVTTREAAGLLLRERLQESSKPATRSKPRKAAIERTSEMNFDQHSRAGRANIDEAVVRHLGKLKAPASRRAIATAVGLDDGVASAALKRLVQQGKAKSDGVRSQTVYSAPGATKKAAK